MQKNIHATTLLLFCYSLVLADDLYSHVCPSTESALACDELCKLIDSPKIIFSFKVNEKNNVVLLSRDYFNENDDTKLLNIPISLRNCSVVSTEDWVCGIQERQKLKINVGAYIDLINDVRHKAYNRKKSYADEGIIHVMRDGQYSVLQYYDSIRFECAK